MRLARRVQRRRIKRRRNDTLPLEQALDILGLLASRPTGLTVIEVAGRLRCPADEVIRTIALMQRRQWLRTDAPGGGFTLGERLAQLSKNAGELDAD